MNVKRWEQATAADWPTIEQALAAAGHWAEEAEQIEKSIRANARGLWSHEDGLRAIGLAQAWATIAAALRPNESFDPALRAELAREWLARDRDEGAGA